MKNYNLYFTETNKTTYLANYESVSATQIAARLAGEPQFSDDVIVLAANNTYNGMGSKFLNLVHEFRNQRV